mmetsp:Transcript_55175/g.134073  ORF Transcript_55175/g.134073 Transcript_55175/m.134073 type:complete len:233 (+) Transcript_55175:1958-2656(+)
MPTRTTPHVGSSTHTWVGYSSRRTPPSSRPDGKWTFLTSWLTRWLRSRRNATRGSLCTCVTSCPHKSQPMVGVKISGTPSSLPVPSVTASSYTLPGWSIPLPTCTVTTRTMSCPIQLRTPSSHGVPSVRDGTTGITSTHSTTPRPSTVSRHSSTLASCSSMLWRRSDLSGAESVEQPLGRWDVPVATVTLLPVFLYRKLLQDLGKSRRANKLRTKKYTPDGHHHGCSSIRLI